ncbi:hypothetical protein Glove_174g132 [Diversispora epigaea]|uniref:Uncharacterized protein n=1 Tax=Diversispora epigaea TaxID=1348612 RepID=A0A397IXI7_9GLOM|nr:hypothetical protein Glove_174g132 [Diversispora epigaea]
MSKNIIDEIDSILYPVQMFDLLLPDVHSKEIHEEISKKLNIKYLSNSLHTEVKYVRGIIFGPYFRIFISLPVQIKQEVKNVHFLIDTGSPTTFICEEVYESFKVTMLDSSVYRVHINNIPILAQLPPINSHFTDVNLLGTEFLKIFDAKLTMDFENEYVFLSFSSFNITTQNEFNSFNITTQNGEQKFFQLKYILGGIVGFGLFCLSLFFILKKKLH